MTPKATAIIALVLGLAASAAGAAKPSRYDHVIVIVEENKDYDQILDGRVAPNIANLARRYGSATRFFGEVHPSEANYVALLAGNTFGIHDDDAYYCRAGSRDAFCDHAEEPGYADHTRRERHLGDQLDAIGLSWRGYYGSLPSPGSGVVTAGDPAFPSAPRTAFYASKHSGFLNFADVQNSSQRMDRIVGMDRFDADLAREDLPAFALVVPNQCDEMHGLHGPGIPADCDASDKTALIRRGDTVAGDIVRRIMKTRTWNARGNVAIVVTFDEGANRGREGCCAAEPTPGSDLGGGHIPTIVVTNHGPRGVSDDTPYNHYSLLRTIEDALGVAEHLGHAADEQAGVVPMTRLFEVEGRARDFARSEDRPRH